MKEKQEQIKKALKALRDKNISKLLEGSLLKAARDSLNREIELHSQFLKTWNDKGLEESMKEIKSQTEKLNSSYQSLEETYKKWEIIKQHLSSIHSYSSLIVNSICSQKQSQEQQSGECSNMLNQTI
ncbi:hypothetical protein [Candidatus Mycoplasma haematominutum]|uniref:Uncharacterized protein n=1 Tax=Candidatus Mycoplasma haematominutum 'Birmingham 1' TaxID=1116213 RepID=G8C3G7_9MOLU|nr:hypothetical protein [Candidatus Mycoplasma haematominutum]CCE66865.1 hypothetical protein MHM_03470 [Candidatus Mycoplasma haematominutum 'Birmingham 1']